MKGPGLGPGRASVPASQGQRRPFGLRRRGLLAPAAHHGPLGARGGPRIPGLLHPAPQRRRRAGRGSGFARGHSGPRGCVGRGEKEVATSGLLPFFLGWGLGGVGEGG